MTEVTTVCHIATLTRWGGVERQLVDFLTSVDQKTVKHLVITTSSQPEIVQPLKDVGIEIFEPVRRFHHDPGAIIQMAKWLRRHNVDIVHSYNAFANAWANMAALYARIPVYMTYEHGTIWNTRPPVAWLDRWANQRADLVVANSKASARMLELRYKIPRNKIKVIYNAVPEISHADANIIKQELGIPRDALVVGSIGRLDTAKDFATFVKSAAHVLKGRKDIFFVLIGGGLQETMLQRLVNDLGIQKHFLMTGRREDARRLLHCFDIFVNTSITESLGNVLIEAALCEKPMIAPRIDGIPEIVIDGKTGILIDPSKPIKTTSHNHLKSLPLISLNNGKMVKPMSINYYELSNTILTLIGNKTLRKNLGMNAYNFVKNKFTFNTYINEIMNTYIEILRSK